jgi:hypothetical protein
MNDKVTRLRGIDHGSELLTMDFDVTVSCGVGDNCAVMYQGGYYLSDLHRFIRFRAARL